MFFRIYKKTYIVFQETCHLTNRFSYFLFKFEPERLDLLFSIVGGFFVQEEEEDRCKVALEPGHDQVHVLPLGRDPGPL